MDDHGPPPRSWLLDVLWLDAVIVPWWTTRSGAERYIAVPDVGSVGQLLPWRPSSVIASTRRVSDDRASAIRVRDGAAVAGVLVASTWSRRRRLSVHGTASLIGQVGDRLGVPDATGIVISGPPRANQKPVIQLHDRAGRTIAYVKVAWNGLTQRLLSHERRALETLATREDCGFVVPRILATGSFASVTWLAIGPITVARRHRADLHAIDRLASAVERTAPTWRGPTSEAVFLTELRAQSASLEVGRCAVEALAAREADRPISLGASHGDFVPWNMLSGYPRAAVWDWERYSLAEPLGVDRLHYRFQVGVQRKRRSAAEVLTSLDSELDTVLPDVARDRRGSHLDWYIVSLLCRYERDSLEQGTPGLRDRIAHLTAVLNQRGVLA